MLSLPHSILEYDYVFSLVNINFGNSRTLNLLIQEFYSLQYTLEYTSYLHFKKCLSQISVLTFSFSQTIIGIETNGFAYNIADHTPVSYGPGVFYYRSTRYEQDFFNHQFSIKKIEISRFDYLQWQPC